MRFCKAAAVAVAAEEDFEVDQSVE